MEKTTLEQVEKEAAKRTKKDFFLAIFYLVPGLGIAWGIIEGMEHLQIKTFSTADSFLTTPNSNPLFQLMIILIAFLIIPSILEFILINRSKLTGKKFLKRILLFIIPCIPVMYLSFFSYLEVGEHSITYDPFLSGEKKTYAWEDIESVVIDKATSRNKRFDYYVNFKDGTNIDIWGNTRMNIEELKQIDDRIRAKGIPKYVNVPPYEKGLKDAYGDSPNKYKMVQQIVSE
ncbi:hypothetical protein [Niallia sp.]|uniref:hypothetical protein n=1 Tax=Niallia sp. TaxID=2837523 RepID=UPI0028A04979|nr:hypothetical protein [Niallia sp.]